MLCPLKKESYPGNSPGFVGVTFGECEQEKCAWWTTTGLAQWQGKPGICVITAISNALDEMLLSGLPTK